MDAGNPAVSIVIPAYNRIGPLRQTLASAGTAAEALGEPVEILLVDDGSEPPLEEALAGDKKPQGVRFIRQDNQGSIVARQTGLSEARGPFVLFLDSDDLITGDKLQLHVAALRASQADVCYDDVGEIRKAKDGSEAIGVRSRLAIAGTAEDLFLRVQPPPHGPVYRRDYLNRSLAEPLLPALRKFDSVGDIWLFYNLCIHPARVTKIDKPLSLTGEHEEGRYSQHWERLGFASLGVMEAFMRRCPITAQTERARMRVGELAFGSWRRLPRGFSPDFSRRLLDIWQRAPLHEQMDLGGRSYRALAWVFGAVGAARLLRLRNGPYRRIRTIDDAEIERLGRESKGD